MNIDSIVLGLLAASSLVALLCRRHDKAANIVGAWGCILALILKLFTFDTLGLEICFQLPIVLVGLAAVWHSIGYMRNGNCGRMHWYWALMAFTLFTMLAVSSLDKGFTFLVMWELMGLSSFALVAFEWKKTSVRYAAWVYLLACEAGGLLLLWVLSQTAAIAGKVPEPLVLTVILIAFGLKAGFPLLHVWLPEAHPAAPAPVSALMSGAMIPLGFYGIVTWGPEILITSSFGWMLLILGITGMILGILFGLAQRDLKRLLAYSSVENIGIITMALGLGILGGCYDNLQMQLLAWTGMALHIINHSLLKGTLFLAAGAVYRAVHTLDMDLMGGLFRKMPVCGLLFTSSGIGISGLPPFCGFTGELLIYIAAFHGVVQGHGRIFAASAAAIAALALTGGLAAAGFSKATAGVFAGEARSEAARGVIKEDFYMTTAQIFIEVLAVLMTFAAPFFTINNLPAEINSGKIMLPLVYNALFALGVIYLTVLLMLFRHWLGKRRPDRSGVTWDCGYIRPDGRMQYTASAFVQPLSDLFNNILRQKKELIRPEGLFPDAADLTIETPDGGSRWFWQPVFRAASFVSDRVKHLQSGLLHVYILMMMLAIVVMLIWCFVGDDIQENIVNDSLNIVEVTDNE